MAQYDKMTLGARALGKILCAATSAVFVLALSLASAASSPAPWEPAGSVIRAPQSLQEISFTAEEREQLFKGGIVLRDIPNPGKPGKTGEALGILPVGLDEAFAVIIDFRRYPEFMPNVVRTDVKDEDPATFIVDVWLDLPLGQKRQYRLRYRVARTDGGFEVVWEKIPWPEVPSRKTVKDTAGSWRVTRLEGGEILAVYHVYSDAGSLPPITKSIVENMNRKGLANVIERTRQRILSLYPQVNPLRGNPRT